MSGLERTERLGHLIEVTDRRGRPRPPRSEGFRRGGHWEPPDFTDWFMDAPVVLCAAAKFLEKVGWTRDPVRGGAGLTLDRAITTAARELSGEQKLADPGHARDRALTLVAISVEAEDADLTELRHYPWPRIVRWGQTPGLTEDVVLETLWALVDHYGPLYEQMARDVRDELA